MRFSVLSSIARLNGGIYDVRPVTPGVDFSNFEIALDVEGFEQLDDGIAKLQLYICYADDQTTQVQREAYIQEDIHPGKGTGGVAEAGKKTQYSRSKSAFLSERSDTFVHDPILLAYLLGHMAYPGAEIYGDETAPMNLHETFTDFMAGEMKYGKMMDEQIMKMFGKEHLKYVQAQNELALYYDPKTSHVVAQWVDEATRGQQKAFGKRWKNAGRSRIGVLLQKTSQGYTAAKR